MALLSKTTWLGILALAALSDCLFSQVVYVANNGSNDVSAYSVDPGSGALTAVPGSPFPAWPVPVAAPNGSVNSGPAAAAVDPSGKFLYVGGPRSDTVNAYISAFTVNAATGALSAIPGSPYKVGSFSQIPGIAVDPAGKFVYAAISPYDMIVGFTINAVTGALTAVPGSPFSFEVSVGNLAVSPTGKYIYSAVGYAGSVSAFSINASSGAIGKVPGSPFTAGDQASSVAVDPTGKFVYVPNVTTCISCATGDVWAFSVSPSNGALTKVPGSPFPAGLGPFASAVDPAGKFLYVTNSLSGSVSAYSINAGSGALTAIPGSPYVAGSLPEAVAADPSGKFLYVANSFSNTVSAYTINAGSGALTPVPGSPLPTGKGPAAIAISRLTIAPPVAAITAIAPSSATAGGPAFTLTVTGTGFLSGSTVQWNGSPLSTTLVSATQLTAAVPASLIAAAGSANITAAGSKAVSFTIIPAVVSIPITITADGVVNAASKTAGAVASGEIVAIAGSGFGPGAQALFDGTSAPLLDAQAGAARVVVPYSVNGQASTQLQVAFQGQVSNPVQLPVAATAPGIFTADSSGGGQAVAVNQDGSMNSPGNPASAGSIVVISATGEGQTDPPGVDGKPADSPAPIPLQPVTATIGGLDAPVLSAGGVPGLVAGYLQVAVQIPDGITPGDSLPIVLRIGDGASQPNVTLAVQ